MSGELFRTDHADRPDIRRATVGSAIATRFCTCTWAVSTSVPSLNVTSKVYEPSLLLCDVMYSMFSTPTTCCSIGAATVSAITLALAPGIWPSPGPLAARFPDTRQSAAAPRR